MYIDAVDETEIYFAASSYYCICFLSLGTKSTILSHEYIIFPLGACILKNYCCSPHSFLKLFFKDMTQTEHHRIKLWHHVSHLYAK